MIFLSLIQGTILQKTYSMRSTSMLFRQIYGGFDYCSVDLKPRGIVKQCKTDVLAGRLRPVLRPIENTSVIFTIEVHRRKASII